MTLSTYLTSPIPCNSLFSQTECPPAVKTGPEPEAERTFGYLALWGNAGSVLDEPNGKIYMLLPAISIEDGDDPTNCFAPYKYAPGNYYIADSSRNAISHPFFLPEEPVRFETRDVDGDGDRDFVIGFANGNEDISYNVLNDTKGTNTCPSAAPSQNALQWVAENHPDAMRCLDDPLIALRAKSSADDYYASLLSYFTDDAPNTSSSLNAAYGVEEIERARDDELADIKEMLLQAAIRHSTDEGCLSEVDRLRAALSESYGPANRMHSAAYAAAAQHCKTDGGLGINFSYHGEGQVVVDEILPGSSAAKYGLKKGDLITRVGSKTADLSNFRQNVLGPYGKPIRLTLLRDGEEVNLTIPRNYNFLPEFFAEGLEQR